MGKHKRRDQANGWHAAGCLALGTGVIVLTVLGALGKFSASSGSSAPPVPFYQDPSLMACWYPLETNYVDSTFKTSASLLNVTSYCVPSFTLNQTLPDNTTGSVWYNLCPGDGQGILIASALWPAKFTLSVWVRALLSPQQAVVAGSKQSIDAEFTDAVVLYDNAEIDVTLGGDLSTLHADGPWQVRRWYHIVVSSGLGVFVDGKSLSTGLSTPDTTLPLVIGNDINLSSEDNTFLGNIMGVRMFTVELTLAQIQTLYELKGR